MTKKHFDRIAELLKARITLVTPAHSDPAYDEGKRRGAEDTARDMAKLFKEFNPLFDAERFLKACGL